MQIVYYLLTFVCGLLGTLGLLRSIERLITGQGVMVVQLAIGCGFLSLAWKTLRKARAASIAKKRQRAMNKNIEPRRESGTPPA